MTAKCKLCNKNIQTHSRCLACSVCHQFTHIQCLCNISADDPLYTKRTQNNWLCTCCSSEIFPFNHCDDEHDFLYQIDTFFDLTRNIAELEKLIFNPFEVNDTSDFNIMPLQDLDPDLHFYSEFAQLNKECTCNYYVEETFNSKISELNENVLSLFHLNIRSVPRNLDSLLSYLSNINHNFKVIGLSETWLTAHNYDLYDIPQYKHVKAFRQNRMGGGVSLFIQENINFTERNDLNVFNDTMESIFVEIDKSQLSCRNNLIVGLIYRPPNSNVSEYSQLLNENILSKIRLENKTLYLLGDFNINLLNIDHHTPSAENLEMLYSHSMFPLITKPTRVRSNSATLIDNIFGNDLLNTKKINGILYTGISDHYPIFSILTDKTQKEKVTSVQYRSYSQNNISKFSETLEALNWEEALKCTDATLAFSKFYEKFKDIYEQHFPTKSYKVTYKNRKNWLSASLKKCIKIKNKLFYLSRKYPSEYNVTKYSEYKKNLCRLLKTAEKEYYDNLFKRYKNNLKKSWDIIKSVINRKKSAQITDEFSIDNVLTKNREVIADSFNNYFTNIGSNLSKTIPLSNRDPLSYMRDINIQSSLLMAPTNESELKHIIMNLKSNTPGYDDINGKIVKNTFHLYSKPLIHLINLSLSQGIFPEQLKVARIMPVFKSGDSKTVSNYRPISILPYFSKIFEKVICKRLATFIDKHNILYKYQFGFRQNHSTALALVTLVDSITSSLDNNQITLGICLDFSKAFDTIDHAILMKKLYSYGIRGISHDLIKSYISNRKQFVNYNGCSSTMKNINCGVPQGSILGPLLFILYINDISNVSHKVLPILYADDSNLFVKGNNIDEMISMLNAELSKIYEWLNVNRLSLNIDKTQCILFKGKKKKINRTSNVNVSNRIITFVDHIKFLGVTIDSSLTWEHHSKCIRNKMSKGIGILTKAKKNLKRETLTTLYYSFVYPYINYAIEIWGGMKVTELDSISNLQRRALRIIAGVPYQSSSEPLFKSLKILNVKKVYISKVAMFMYNVDKGNYPGCITDMYSTNSLYHEYYTRQHDSLHVPICRNDYMKRNIRYVGVLLFGILCF